MIPVIIEFFTTPVVEVITDLGMEFTGQSRRFNLVYAKGTKDQISALSDSSLVKSISYAAPTDIG